MFECDLHIHSIRSTCGFHTLLEIVNIMREKGFKGFALTDHSPVHNTPHAHFSVMLRRMPGVINGLRVFKGIEATILNDEGDLDVPKFAGNPYEIILAALHELPEYSTNANKIKNTRAVINVMKKNPSVNVITHPYYKSFPVDLDAITDIACETNTALEINNSYILNGKADLEALASMLELAREKGTMLCVNSDGHLFHEMGSYNLALKFIESYGVENLNIINRTLKSTCAFLGLEE